MNHRIAGPKFVVGICLVAVAIVANVEWSLTAEKPGIGQPDGHAPQYASPLPARSTAASAVRQPGKVASRAFAKASEPARAIRQPDKSNPSFVSPQPDRNQHAPLLRSLPAGPSQPTRILAADLARQPDSRAADFVSANAVPRKSDVRQPAPGSTRLAVPRSHREAPPSAVRQPDRNNPSFVSPNPDLSVARPN
jgi:hypothetical protein